MKIRSVGKPRIKLYGVKRGKKIYYDAKINSITDAKRLQGLAKLEGVKTYIEVKKK